MSAQNWRALRKFLGRFQVALGIYSVSAECCARRGYRRVMAELSMASPITLTDGADLVIHQRIRPTWGLGVALLATALAWTVEARASSLTLNFSSPIPGTVADQNGNGTGLTDRLPGTGGALPSNDPNLALNTSQGVLQITSTNSDLNGQLNMASGEYLGTRLADLGFTGSQNFSVSATFLNVQYSQDYDQFGLYVGNASDQNFRAGFVFASLAGGRSMFSTPNSGVDFNTVFGSNAPALGDDIVLTLSRTGGTYCRLSEPDQSGPVGPAQHGPANFPQWPDQSLRRHVCGKRSQQRSEGRHD